MLKTSRRLLLVAPDGTTNATIWSDVAGFDGCDLALTVVLSDAAPIPGQSKAMTPRSLARPVASFSKTCRFSG